MAMTLFAEEMQFEIGWLWIYIRSHPFCERGLV